MKSQKDNNRFIILAIETSCDETSAAVLEVTEKLPRGFNKLQRVTKSYPQPLVTKSNLSQPLVTILSNIVSSQVKLHAKYGGVYPELASREHIKNILPVIEEGLQKVTKSYKELQGVTRSYNKAATISNQLQPLVTLSNYIDYIAVTIGPGLIGSLLVGVETAKTLAYVLGKPIVAVNHLEGHIYANFVGNQVTKGYEKLQGVIKSYNKTATISNQSQPLVAPSNLSEFPAMALIVSGGHTSLVYMKDHLDYQIIGETLDDAAGEAFDKVAAMLKLSYPGGPEVEKVAESYDELQRVTKGYKKNHATISNQSQPLVTVSNHFNFPRPMINSKDFNFSFSGLKTAVLYAIKKLPKPLSSKIKALICHEFQNAVVETLVAKTLRAAEKYKVKSILLGGGVAANSALRKEFAYRISHIAHSTNSGQAYRKNQNDKPYAISHKQFFVPAKNLCTDNAAVIGTAAAYKILAGKISGRDRIKANANLEL